MWGVLGDGKNSAIKCINYHHILISKTLRVILHIGIKCEFLNIGNKLFAVPMEAMELDTHEKCYRLNQPKARLEQAEGFDKDHGQIWLIQNRETT
jgi:hypothetical protein